VPAPSTAGIDFFYAAKMGQREPRDQTKGFLLLMNPYTYLLFAAGVRKNPSSKAFRRAFISMRKRYEAQLGPIRTLVSDEDTAFLSDFDKYLEAEGIGRQHETRSQKNEQVERIGGIFKRHLAMTAAEENKKWSAVLSKAVASWNASYVPPSGARPPIHYTSDNFGECVEKLYESNAVKLHSLYESSTLTEELKDGVFKYRMGQKLLVSMKSHSKALRNPIGWVTLLEIVNFCIRDFNSS
jgi:hypothetical protein